MVNRVFWESDLKRGCETVGVWIGGAGDCFLVGVLRWIWGFYVL